jgi:hypothetical protein
MDLFAYFRRRRRARGAVLVETALILPVVAAFFVYGAQVWYGFSRQEAYTKTAGTIAEWAARSGELTTAMTVPLHELLLTSAGVEGQDVYLHVTLFDATGAIIDEVGSTEIAVTGPSAVAPTSSGWEDAGLPLDIPYGAIVEVEVWSHQSLTGESAIRAFTGALEPRWAIPLGRAVATGVAP